MDRDVAIAMRDLFVLTRAKGAGNWTVAEGPLELAVVAAAVAVVFERQPGTIVAVARVLRTFRSTTTVAEDTAPQLEP